MLIDGLDGTASTKIYLQEGSLMNRRFVYAVCVLTLCARPSMAGGSSNAQRVVSGGRPIVLRLSELRSAYLLRAGVVRYDADAVTSQDIRRQIQRHFDVMLGLLLISTPQSIETALDRLEIDRHESWSVAEKQRWRQLLLRNRWAQIARLAAYRDRGLFPQNEGQSAAPAPIFVDRYDTACAVGHLMRLSGWQKAVAAIQRSDNLVYVPDALASAIAQWTLASGLTVEEAALVQPGYPFIVDQTMSDYGPGGPALIRNGLRYENFQGSFQTFVNPPAGIPPAQCQATPLACLGTPGGVAGPLGPQLGIRAGAGIIFEAQTLAYLKPVGTNWLIIGGSGFGFNSRGINGAAPVDQGQLITLVFDVSPVSPEMRINQLSQHSDDLEGGFGWFRFFDPQPTSPDAYYAMISRVVANQNSVATTVLDISTPAVPEIQTNGDQISTVNFEPQSRITVEMQMLLIDGVWVDSIALDFNLVRVPEPGCALLFVAGVAVTAVFQRRPWSSSRR
jgi:hypothetical protein